MKTLKFLICQVLFIISISTVAGISGNIKSNTEAIQIQSILSKIDFKRYTLLPSTFNVSFMINGKNELLIVSTNNRELDEVIKSNLNYKQIAVETLEYHKVYTIPVRLML